MLLKTKDVLSFNERINFNGKYITDKQFEEYVIKIDKANSSKDITFYEYISSMAFLAFYENPQIFQKRFSEYFNVHQFNNK